MKDNFVMKLWCREMGIANCGGRVRDLGMFLLSFGLLSTQREREREREREKRKLYVPSPSSFPQEE